MADYWDQLTVKLKAVMKDQKKELMQADKLAFQWVED
jgi:hypothetical protein